MSNTLVVENLPSDIKPGTLRDLFEQIGEVRGLMVKTGMQSPGKAVIEMALDVDAYRAINCFNETVIQGKKIRLTELPHSTSAP